ncbi:hypothetical protein BGZ60DRAFT_525444 [Tricladium varicosporioides]|nr:hypothetical protein BGZ60DRAFT_525444 [Hymenoscyphus varicosporioides]
MSEAPMTGLHSSNPQQLSRMDIPASKHPLSASLLSFPRTSYLFQYPLRLHLPIRLPLHLSMHSSALLVLAAPLTLALSAPTPEPLPLPEPGPQTFTSIETGSVTSVLTSLPPGVLSIGSATSGVLAIISDTAPVVHSTVPILEAIANGTLRGTDPPRHCADVVSSGQPNGRTIHACTINLAGSRGSRTLEQVN